MPTSDGREPLESRSSSRRTCAIVVAAALIAGLLFIAPTGIWPWDHDEVHTLVELGLVPLTRYPGPRAQLERMHRLVPVFYALQNGALRILPRNEWGSRLLPATCGALVAVLAFVVGLRIWGVWFAWSLLILVAGSPTLVWLSQNNRFYSLALLLCALETLCVWTRDRRWWFDALAIGSGVAAVLAHNLTVVVFGLGFLCAAATGLAGWTPRAVTRRTFLVAAATGAVYLFYLRPILGTWVSGGTGGTTPLLSFAAQVGIPSLGLAVVGCVVAWRGRIEAHAQSWWIALLVASLAFIGAAPWILGNWNPRYGLFFMPPVWVLAAIGADAVARSLPSARLRLAWLAAISVFLMPKLASHFVDGSRHDFRTAAAIVAQHPSGTGQLLSNWPAELQYYLEPLTGQHPRYWAPGQPLPQGRSVVVVASNAWEPVLQAPDRSVAVIGEVGRRRFDEQSHLIRIYLVSDR